ncbi:hypothetical protein LCGC14_3041450, partial [marine sediment metagenome]
EAEVIDILTKAFSRPPRMMTRLGKVMTGRTWKAEKYKFPWPPWDASRVQRLATNPNDRFELQQILDKAGTYHYVYLLKPDAFLFTTRDPREWDWWGKRMGK